jgi:hypothetical protein
MDHFAERGEPFVKDGKLLVRRGTGMLYSPHYPGKSGKSDIERGIG